ncbi:hypothetical protein Esi_0282_0032 [Ectocarpus siliculosus]|uniref:Uncharacterized protein n=1 Tax=Ectocarpus siliculosus TaxID=2880 RepID=D7FUZ4_ECTSI|nr:hypothetical protein Esi_0282_0032 [Ectocarpus siliculosus]|eukprot:CBJ31800.1 hypothetical protein Esi_0282_0032 [Ectocarpus siliculosus]
MIVSQAAVAALVWFRSSSGGGFAEIKGVEGPYYQPSADDLGSRICIKCTLAGTALNFGGTGSGGFLSPTNGGKGRRGRHGRGGGRSGSRSPQRQQDQVSFAEGGPIVLDSPVGAEVDKLLSADGPAVFRGLVRRDTPGETVRVRVEVGREQIRVVAEPGDAAAAADGNSPGAEPPGVTVETAAAASVQPLDDVTGGSPEAALATGSGEKRDGGTTEETGAGGEVAAAADGVKPSAAAAAAAAAAASQDGAEAAAVVVLAEGRYSPGVLVTLEPARPTVLRLTVGRGQGGEAAAAVGVRQAPTPPAVVLLLGAVDGIQRDVLALTLRGRRQAALGPGVTVDDYPEETKAHQAHEDYLELKAAAANFASAYDEDGTSATSRSGSSAEDDDDHDDDHEEPDSGSYYDTSEEDDGEEVDTDTGEESGADGETGRGGNHRGGGGGRARRASWKGGGSGSGTLARAASRGSLPAATATAGGGGGGTGAGPQGGVGGVADAAPWEAAGSGGEGEKGAGGGPRSA